MLWADSAGLQETPTINVIFVDTVVIIVTVTLSLGTATVLCQVLLSCR